LALIERSDCGGILKAAWLAQVTGSRRAAANHILAIAAIGTGKPMALGA